MIGSMAILVNSKNEGPLPHFIYCQMSSLFKSVAVCNAMTVDKVSVVLSETLQRENTHTKYLLFILVRKKCCSFYNIKGIILSICFQEPGHGLGEFGHSQG